MKCGGERRQEFHHGETCWRCFPHLGNRVKLPLRGIRFTTQIRCAHLAIPRAASLPASSPRAWSPAQYSRPGLAFPPPSPSTASASPSSTSSACASPRARRSARHESAAGRGRFQASWWRQRRKRTRAAGLEECIPACAITASDFLTGVVSSFASCADCHPYRGDSRPCYSWFIPCCAGIHYATSTTARSRMGCRSPKFCICSCKPTRPKSMVINLALWF
jgi:hypothetical protein